MKSMTSPFSLNAFSLSACAVIALVLGCSGTQAQTKFIKESQVTEQAMIDALRPAEPASGPGMKTRSLRVTPSEPARAGSSGQREPRAAAPRESSGSAPVLLTFEPNATELTPRAKKALDVVARSLTHADLASLSFAIEGHADPRGNPDDNLKLSTQRAEAVKSYLVAQHGIADSRLQVVGKGDSQPATPKNPAAPENRRVTFVTIQ